MIIFPAIDIRKKKCVRLTQGDYSKMTIYDSDPLKVAIKWQSKGAEFLHIVDLDGAKDGERINNSIIEKIVKAIKVPVQIGGGIRKTETVEELLTSGVSRVIIGTGAIKDLKWLKEIVKIYGEKICVSIDARDGFVATDGWKEISEVKAVDFAIELENIGIKTIVYTDIKKDGMLKGPNFEMYAELIKKVNLDIIASGGISTLKDIEKLKQMSIYGAIVGKALYDEKIKLEEAISC
ncbi:MAG: 1-(5-phosphoribosyl)-5-[(5-phosphoribosylamino)methylideneamino]imidazole-4-carboxamide isomerase [Clostridiales bacterium]|nr:1-(5-phosphoribosyl)-5-[(5-phosphoribosylamino)methylideneamino]imidazole-4-carboxamide isomerase [Clostridiales bacterium]